jgi:hypothetical protein
MIEFFISKLWALLSGVAVFSVVAASINGAVHVASDQCREEALDRLVWNIALLGGGHQAHMEIAMADYLIDDEILIIYNGSIELVGDGYSHVKDLPRSTFILGKDGIELRGEAHLILSTGSILGIEISDLGGKGRIEIYEAKTSTNFSTDSTNLLASPMVL